GAVDEGLAGARVEDVDQLSSENGFVFSGHVLKVRRRGHLSGRAVRWSHPTGAHHPVSGGGHLSFLALPRRGSRPRRRPRRPSPSPRRPSAPPSRSRTSRRSRRPPTGPPP